MERVVQGAVIEENAPRAAGKEQRKPRHPILREDRPRDFSSVAGHHPEMLLTPYG